MAGFRYRCQACKKPGEILYASRLQAYVELIESHVPKEHPVLRDRYTLRRGKKFVEANTLGRAGRPSTVFYEVASRSDRIIKFSCKTCVLEFNLAEAKAHERAHQVRAVMG